MKLFDYPGIVFSLACGLILSSCTTNAQQQIPCIGNALELRALNVGRSLQMQVGSLNESDCIVSNGAAKSWTWTTSDPAIIKVSAIGIVKGRKPGNFTLNAANGNKLLTAQGFILPADWTIKIQPAAATVKVGQVVQFQVMAYDAKNQPLPTVPFSLYTPEFFEPGSSKDPLVDKVSYQQVTNPGTFRATKPGVTIITGELGGKTVQAKLTITESVPPH